MDIRFDTADLTGLREAVSIAMSQALRLAPQGGYSSPESALAAVREALTTLPLEGTPTGYAASHPQMDAYLDQRVRPVGEHLVMVSQDVSPTMMPRLDLDIEPPVVVVNPTHRESAAGDHPQISQDSPATNPSDGMAAAPPPPADHEEVE